MNIHTPSHDGTLTDVSDGNMTSKGQVLIPKVLRDRTGLQPGKPVAIGIDDRGQIVIVTPEQARRRNETPEQRRARVRAAVAAIDGKYDFGGGTTDEIMHDLRGDRTP